MSIPEKMASELLVKCGRHCCICRRFDPLHLQVHHITEKSEGGKDEPDNLIVTCLTCHSDIHTHTKLTRRFTKNELIGHRDTVIELVSSGKLVASSEIDDSSEIIERLISRLEINESCPNLDEDIPAYAIELLVELVQKDGIIYDMSEELTSSTTVDDLRRVGKIKAAIEHLEDNGLLTYMTGIVYRVTHKGFLVADKIIAMADSIPRPDDQEGCGLGS